MWFPNRSDTNRAVQAQKMARDWEFRIWKVEELYYPCSENKGAKLICTFVFAYANCWFSHEVARYEGREGRSVITIMALSVKLQRFINII